MDRKNNLLRLRNHRKNLRNQATKVEIVLWTYLSKSKLCGKKFRRQHSICNYIFDFYCPGEKLGIELDGQIHFMNNGQEYDKERGVFLMKKGIKVLRFTNSQVEQDVGNVLEVIKKSFKTTPDPSLVGGEEVQ